LTCDGKITKIDFHILSCHGFVFKMLDIDGDGRITQKESNRGFDILGLTRSTTASPSAGNLMPHLRPTLTFLIRIRTASCFARNAKQLLRSWISIVTD